VPSPRRLTRAGHTGARRALPALLLGAALLAGCGGGSEQNAGEQHKAYRVRVLRASFPRVQPIARRQRMELIVRNAGLATIPNVTVTVDSFDYASNFPGLADNRRPVWVIEKGPGPLTHPPVETQEVSRPGGAQTAYVNTWSLGPLRPGRTQRYAWIVMPVKPGLHVVHYLVGAGVGGKSTTRVPGGGPAAGRFAVAISKAPPQTHVDPATGKVVVGSYPTS
jgi:hypothetical protein